jgi:hypothetical protein
MSPVSALEPNPLRPIRNKRVNTCVRAEWSPVYYAQPLFSAVWGTSPTDVFVVGSGGFIAHYGQND